ncbi:MAG TPA: diaminopimelate decarboxylase [Candidatus Acidoferrales bacterium]|nr:diaminopimelate decarboxylase [Candidatus Acidoferrales bacterium]
MSAATSHSSALHAAQSAVADPVTYTDGFAYHGSQLYCEGVSVAAVAQKYGTPAYLYSRASIERAYKRMDSAFGALPHTICYAAKANSTLGVLRVFSSMCSGFDIVSGGELYRLQRIGVAGKRIVFSGVGKSREEIREALRARILLFNIESAAELDLLASEAAKLRVRAACSIRVNPDVKAGGHPHIATGHHSHKFGIDWDTAHSLYLKHRASRWIEWQGISAHIGSQILSVNPHRRALTRLANFARELMSAGINLKYIDCGGGLGIRYTSEQPPETAAWAAELARVVKPLGCHLLIEPGRSLIGPAGVLVLKVLYNKDTRGKNFVIVDGAMNDFMRPALYDATHPITRARRSAGPLDLADIVGPVCESGDCFLQNWPLGKVKSGDVLVLWGAGAYGTVQTSNYNSRPRPVEILVHGNIMKVIRKRESRADLVRGE